MEGKAWVVPGILSPQVCQKIIFSLSFKQKTRWISVLMPFLQKWLFYTWVFKQAYYKHTSKKLVPLVPRNRRWFWIFRRKIVWERENYQARLRGVEPSLPCYLWNYPAIVSVANKHLCEPGSFWNNAYKSHMPFFSSKIIEFDWFMHFCRKILSWGFAHFFRRIFWPEKQNPQTLSLFGCMDLNNTYLPTYILGLSEKAGYPIYWLISYLDACIPM